MKAVAEKRKIVDEALKAEKFPAELLAQLPTAGWGAPSQQPKRAETEAAEALPEKSKRRRRTEETPGMPKVYRRSHNMEVAVAPPVAAFQGGVAPVSADLKAFLQESLYGEGVKRVASASSGSLRRPGASPALLPPTRLHDSAQARRGAAQARPQTLRPQRRRP